MKNLLLFTLALGLCFACTEGQKSEAELQAKLRREATAASDKLETERNRLAEERLALQTEREAAQLQKQTDAANAKLEEEFSQADRAMVKKSRAYFHSMPNEASMMERKFLIRGDEIKVLRVRNGFGYVEYYNENSEKYTSGWLNLRDLDPLVYGC